MTEGERWTHEELQRLRAARLHPAAMARFLLASQRRAASARRARPGVARRQDRWALAGAGAWLGLAALDVKPFRRRLQAGLGGWTVTMMMLDWHLGMVETLDGRPRNLGAADAATLLRAWLVPAVADRGSPLLCTIGFATDALDGRLARSAEPTRLGRDMEGVVDVAFAVAVLRGVRRRDALGQLAICCEAARLAAGVVYALGVYFGRARRPDPRLLRAGRLAAPIRAAGLILAGLGRRRAGEVLLMSGAAAAAVLASPALDRVGRGGLRRRAGRGTVSGRPGSDHA